MSISPANFLNAAERLLAGEDEVDHRNAASRAYYGMYHACQQWCDSLDGFAISGTGRGGVHFRFIQAMADYRGPEADKVKSIGNMLKHIKNLRVKADYKLHESFSAAYAAIACNTSRKAMEEIQLV